MDENGPGSWWFTYSQKVISHTEINLVIPKCGALQLRSFQPKYIRAPNTGITRHYEWSCIWLGIIGSLVGLYNLPASKTRGGKEQCIHEMSPPALWAQLPIPCLLLVLGKRHGLKTGTNATMVTKGETHLRQGHCIHSFIIHLSLDLHIWYPHMHLYIACAHA